MADAVTRDRADAAGSARAPVWAGAEDSLAAQVARLTAARPV
jgi:hypothetical protein